MNKHEVISIVSIMLLMVVVSITFLTAFRTCEVLHNGKIIQKNCMSLGQEISSFAK